MRGGKFIKGDNMKNLTFTAYKEVSDILGILPRGYRSEFIREAIYYYAKSLGYRIEVKESRIEQIKKNKLHLEYLFNLKK